jgi:hypothetical protein
MSTQTHETSAFTIVRNDGTTCERIVHQDRERDDITVDIPAPTGGPWTAPPPHRAAACFDDDSGSSMRGAGIAFALAGIALAVLVVVFAPKIGAALLGMLAFWGAR